MQGVDLEEEAEVAAEVEVAAVVAVKAACGRVDYRMPDTVSCWVRPTSKPMRFDNARAPCRPVWLSLV